MKRFLIAASIAAVLAPSLAAPSFAQDADGRGRGGRGDQGQPRGDRGGERSGRGGVLVQPQPQQVQPAPAAPQAQVQPQRQDRGQRQDRSQFQGQREDPGQFQGQAQRQDRGQFQGQDRGQFQGQRNFSQDRNRGVDNRQTFQGRQDNRRYDNNNRNYSSRRYQGAAPRGGQRFSYQGRDFYRFRTQPYSWPRGYNYNSVRWSLSQLLPSIFFSQSYYIDPYQYGLPWADPGYQWVRVGNDALLIETYTGLIVDIAPGVFYW